jgi:hypothetical protein
MPTGVRRCGGVSQQFCGQPSFCCCSNHRGAALSVLLPLVVNPAPTDGLTVRVASVGSFRSIMQSITRAEFRGTDSRSAPTRTVWSSWCLDCEHLFCGRSLVPGDPFCRSPATSTVGEAGAISCRGTGGAVLTVALSAHHYPSRDHSEPTKRTKTG